MSSSLPSSPHTPPTPNNSESSFPVPNTNSEKDSNTQETLQHNESTTKVNESSPTLNSASIQPPETESSPSSAVSNDLQTNQNENQSNVQQQTTTSRFSTPQTALRRRKRPRIADNRTTAPDTSDNNTSTTLNNSKSLPPSSKRPKTTTQTAPTQAREPQNLLTISNSMESSSEQIITTSKQTKQHSKSSKRSKSHKLSKKKSETATPKATTQENEQQNQSSTSNSTLPSSIHHSTTSAQSKDAQTTQMILNGEPVVTERTAPARTRPVRDCTNTARSIIRSLYDQETGQEYSDDDEEEYDPTDVEMTDTQTRQAESSQSDADDEKAVQQDNDSKVNDNEEDDVIDNQPQQRPRNHNRLNDNTDDDTTLSEEYVKSINELEKKMNKSIKEIVNSTKLTTSMDIYTTALQINSKRMTMLRNELFDEVPEYLKTLHNPKYKKDGSSRELSIYPPLPRGQHFTPLSLLQTTATSPIPYEIINNMFHSDLIEIRITEDHGLGVFTRCKWSNLMLRVFVPMAVGMIISDEEVNRIISTNTFHRQFIFQITPQNLSKNIEAQYIDMSPTALTAAQVLGLKGSEYICTGINYFAYINEAAKSTSLYNKQNLSTYFNPTAKRLEGRWISSESQLNATVLEHDTELAFDTYSTSYGRMYGADELSLLYTPYQKHTAMKSLTAIDQKRMSSDFVTAAPYIDGTIDPFHSRDFGVSQSTGRDHHDFILYCIPEYLKEPFMVILQRKHKVLLECINLFWSIYWLIHTELVRISKINKTQQPKPLIVTDTAAKLITLVNIQEIDKAEKFEIMDKQWVELWDQVQSMSSEDSQQVLDEVQQVDPTKFVKSIPTSLGEFLLRTNYLLFSEYYSDESSASAQLQTYKKIWTAIKFLKFTVEKHGLSNNYIINGELQIRFAILMNLPQSCDIPLALSHWILNNINQTRATFTKHFSEVAVEAKRNKFKSIPRNPTSSIATKQYSASPEAVEKATQARQRNNNDPPEPVQNNSALSLAQLFMQINNEENKEDKPLDLKYTININHKKLFHKLNIPDIIKRKEIVSYSDTDKDVILQEINRLRTEASNQQLMLDKVTVEHPSDDFILFMQNVLSYVPLHTGPQQQDNSLLPGSAAEELEEKHNLDLEEKLNTIDGKEPQSPTSSTILHSNDLNFINTPETIKTMKESMLKESNIQSAARILFEDMERNNPKEKYKFLNKTFDKFAELIRKMRQSPTASKPILQVLNRIRGRKWRVINISELSNMGFTYTNFITQDGLLKEGEVLKHNADFECDSSRKDLHLKRTTPMLKFEEAVVQLRNKREFVNLGVVRTFDDALGLHVFNINPWASTLRKEPVIIVPSEPNNTVHVKNIIYALLIQQVLWYVPKTTDITNIATTETNESREVGRMLAARHLYRLADVHQWTLREHYLNIIKIQDQLSLAVQHCPSEKFYYYNALRLVYYRLMGQYWNVDNTPVTGIAGSTEKLIVDLFIPAITHSGLISKRITHVINADPIPTVNQMQQQHFHKQLNAIFAHITKLLFHRIQLIPNMLEIEKDGSQGITLKNQDLRIPSELMPRSTDTNPPARDVSTEPDVMSDTEAKSGSNDEESEVSDDDSQSDNQDNQLEDDKAEEDDPAPANAEEDNPAQSSDPDESTKDRRQKCDRTSPKRLHHKHHSRKPKLTIEVEAVRQSPAPSPSPAPSSKEESSATEASESDTDDHKRSKSRKAHPVNAARKINKEDPNSPVPALEQHDMSPTTIASSHPIPSNNSSKSNNSITAAIIQKLDYDEDEPIEISSPKHNKPCPTDEVVDSVHQALEAYGTKDFTAADIAAFNRLHAVFCETIPSIGKRGTRGAILQERLLHICHELEQVKDLMKDSIIDPEQRKLLPNNNPHELIPQDHIAAPLTSHALPIELSDRRRFDQMLLVDVFYKIRIIDQRRQVIADRVYHILQLDDTQAILQRLSVWKEWYKQIMIDIPELHKQIEAQYAAHIAQSVDTTEHKKIYRTYQTIRLNTELQLLWEEQNDYINWFIQRIHELNNPHPESVMTDTAKTHTIAEFNQSIMKVWELYQSKITATIGVFDAFSDTEEIPQVPTKQFPLAKDRDAIMNKNVNKLVRSGRIQKRSAVIGELAKQLHELDNKQGALYTKPNLVHAFNRTATQIAMVQLKEMLEHKEVRGQRFKVDEQIAHIIASINVLAGVDKELAAHDVLHNIAELNDSVINMHADV